MKLSLTILESRTAPAFLGSRNGFVLSADDNDFVPFPDFMAAHATAGNQFTTVVGAASGGGPRVQVRTEGVVTADYFAYEPTFRDGVLVAYESGTVVTGTNPGGGPVVAVWDEFGVQRTRFFAEDPDFRGGISVAIADDIIYTVPGPGGGPVIRAWTLDGVPLGARFGAHPDSRDGWDIIVGDATGDGLDDITLANRMGRVSITDGVSGYYAGFNLPDEYTLAGYEGESLTVGGTEGFLRGRALWTSFPTMVAFDEFDAASGNPNPPPSTGTRPGVYRPIVTVGSGPPNLSDMTTFTDLYVSDSVGTINVGTLSLYPHLKDADGNRYLVTSSHGGRRSPFFGIEQFTELLAPGPLDGPFVTVGHPAIVAPILPGVPYTVDAVAYAPVNCVSLLDTISFNGETVSRNGVIGELQPGDLLITIGRRRFAGSGTYWGKQTGTAPIKWPSGEIVEITGQEIGIGGAVQLAAPGFSGAATFHAAFVDNEVIGRWDYGMVVAGNATTVFITPHALVAGALGLTY